jgi:hypothetical protein
MQKHNRTRDDSQDLVESVVALLTDLHYHILQTSGDSTLPLVEICREFKAQVFRF